MTIPSCYNDNDNIDDDNNWVSVVSSVDSSISVKLKPRAIFKNYILLLARSLGKKWQNIMVQNVEPQNLHSRKKNKNKTKPKKNPIFLLRISIFQENATHSYIHINRLGLFFFFFMKYL